MENSNKKSSIAKESEINQKYSILIVDDNPSFVIAFETLLRSLLGKKLEYFDKAGNGREALEKVVDHPFFDYIFMDVSMPILDGISAAKIINNDFYRNSIIVGISFHNEQNVKKEMIFAGAKYFINKANLTYNELNKLFQL